MFSDFLYKWLEAALDFGITEYEFWNMTLAELERAIESKQRMMKHEARQKACSDYILADLIGRSVARIYNSSNNMPELGEVYPELFDTEEIQEKKAAAQAELSAIRFKQFANSFNQRFNREEAKT